MSVEGRPARRPAAVARSCALALLLAVVAGLTAATPHAAAAAPVPAGPAPAAGPAEPKTSAAAATPGLRRLEREAAMVLARDRKRFLARYAGDPGRPFTTNFIGFRNELHDSALYRALRSMPKGGLQHVHLTALGDMRWIVRRVFTQRGAYIYWGPESETYELGQLAVYPDGGAPAGFITAADFEHIVPHPRRRLLRLFTLGPEDAADPDIWTEFEAIFQRLGGFTSYRPVFLAYYGRAFLDLAQDGAQFVEIHTSVGALFTRHGAKLTDLDVVASFRQALVRVRSSYPSFGLRIIMTSSRTASVEAAAAQVARQRALAAAAPGIIHGFDLVGHEATGHSNAYYAPALTTLPLVPLYLHAGESRSAEDVNVQEALDLGAMRIGHGLTMDLFPGLEQRVRDAGVIVEVCPLSNQALRYVPDLRRHPARGWLRRGTRITLNSDDPGIFGSSGLSDDFTLAYLSWRLTLRDLKRIALRSIATSTLPQDRRARQRALFERRWRAWVADVVGDAAAH